MTFLPLPDRLLAADAFEVMVESAIVRTQDFYDLDGETFLRTLGGRVQTEIL